MVYALHIILIQIHIVFSSPKCFVFLELLFYYYSRSTYDDEKENKVSILLYFSFCSLNFFADFSVWFCFVIIFAEF